MSQEKNLAQLFPKTEKAGASNLNVINNVPNVLYLFEDNNILEDIPTYLKYCYDFLLKYSSLKNKFKNYKM